MTQEDKQLLIKDLCARLSYGVQCSCTWSHEVPNGTVGCVQELSTFLIDEIEIMDNPEYDCQIYDVKPYLRPMSNMTEKERREFSIFTGKTEVCIQQIRLDADSMANPIIGGNKCVYWGLFDKCIDWLNKKMFDYRGLIPMGLALEAPEGMYKTE